MAKSQIRQYVFNPTGTTGGTIVVPGKIDLQQLLIITNTTTNTILYNFADVTYSGTTVSFIRGADSNFPLALDNEDGVTVITIPSTVSTSGMTSANVLQIFFEQTFQYVRSPEIGTDAFERQRTANPQSLLDADFEYGMQPTKWLTISQQRGYPSIYEIPGTDLTVINATTDASVGDGGFSTSESIITITTANAHGYSVGQPFTISGFYSAITGFERAQGSFIVFQVLNSTQFTFIAKGKVGFNNGDNIYTPFIQLRQGGFYTGANINSVINTTITQTVNSTGYISVTSTANMTVGSVFSPSTVVTNAIATNASNNYVTLGTTVGLAVGMPLVFSGTSFGGLTTGTTYYVVSIVNSQNVTLSTSTNLTPVFTPTTSAFNGNMSVVGGASFGGITSGSVYYISSIVNGTQITLSNNIVYTTTITSTNAILNSARFGTTTNMTVGETVVITGSTIGNLTAGTYYVLQILDSANAILSTSVGGTAFVQSTATGTMNATVGVNITLSSGTTNGYLWATTVSPPSISYTTPPTVVSFTGAISGNVLTATANTGTFAIGQGVSGASVPSATVITAQLTATNTAAAITTLIAGGVVGSFTFTVNSGTNIAIGQLVSGYGIPNSTFVTALNAQIVTISNAFTQVGTGTYNFNVPFQAGTYSINQNGGSISAEAMTTVSAQPTITVNTTSPHGFIPGDTINMFVTSENGANNHTLCTGPFFVESVQSNVVNGITVANQFTFTSRGVGVITGTVVAQLYARPDSFYSHRPFDGGVQLGTGLPAHGSQAIRMSKKYIRYQSGKSINFNTGLLMAPNYFVRSVSANSSVYATGLSITAVTATNGFVTITSGTYTQGQAIIVTGTISTSTGLTAGTYYVLTGGTNVTSIQLSGTLANILTNTPVTFTATGLVSGTSVTQAPIITVTTDDVDHGCQLGATVVVSGSGTPGYNGTYTVVGIIDERNLQVIAQTSPGLVNGNTNAQITDPSLLSLQNWYGAVVRSGTYDEQNGVFFQYDGQVISVVKRSSTFQLAGTISVVVGSGQVIGINTRFTTQLWAGDRIVIRGMSHIVTQVISDTLMYVNPQYRGYANVSGIKCTKTIDRIIPQSQWNMDHCDGSNGPANPSGYQINPIKMNMVAMQWTWYGAGFIDWMIRGPEGKYITVHRLRNNNLNNEAWMRAGNMPVRYEVTNEGWHTYIVGSVNIGVGDTVIPVADATYFPTPTTGNTCTVYIDNEFINYSAKINTVATAVSNGNTITVGSTANMAVGQPIVFLQQFGLAMGGVVANQTYYIASIGTNTITLATNVGLTSLVTNLTNYTYNPYGASTTNFYMTVNALVLTSTAGRGASIIPWATGGYRTFNAGSAATHTVLTGVISVNGSASPIVSHWGAAFIEDGGFDADRSYIFNYQATNVTITTKKTTAFAIRLAPSVSNALTGDLGSRELINRASFLLQQLESCAGSSANANTAIVIEGIINPSNMPSSGNIVFNSLNSTVNPTGQPSFSQVAPGSSMVFTNSITNPTTITSSPSAGSTTFTVASANGVQVGDDVYFPGVTNAVYGLTKVSAINGSNITISQPLLQALTANSTINNVTVVNTAYTFNCTATALVVNQQVVVSGTTSGGGSITSYSNPTTYYIVATNGSTGFTLSTSQGGAPVGATTGTLVGLTFNLPNSGVVQFSRGTYALPGETVFSYINSPANKDALDLSNLKELTNTPIGGRGTYPNGCDVLFINAYITQGSPLNQNLILRWGEAQA